MVAATKRLFWGVLLVLLLAVTVRAEQPLQLSAAQELVPLGLHLELLEDPSRQLTITQIASAAYADAFVPSNHNVPQFGYTRSAHWARFAVVNTGQSATDWLLEVADPSLDSLNLYVLPAGSSTPLFSRHTGDLQPRSTRGVDHYHFVFHLPLEPGQTYNVYLRVENQGATPLPLALMTPMAFSAQNTNRMFGHGFFYGLVVIIICFNLFMFIFLRESMYLFYMLTATSLGLYFASLDGLAGQYLWPNQIWWGNVAILVFVGATLISGIHFCLRFLQLAHYVPALDKMLWGVSLVVAVVVALAVMPGLYRPAAQALALLTAATVVLGVLAAVVVWGKGYRPARYFLLAWAGVFIGAVLVILKQFNLLSPNFFSESGLRIGTFWLLLLLSLAVADRINLFRVTAATASERLHRSENQLRQLLEAMPLGVLVIDQAYRVAFINQRGQDILRLIGQTVPADAHMSEILKLFPAHINGSAPLLTEAESPLTQALQGRRSNTTNLELGLNDRRVPLEIWAEPVVDEHGAPAFAIAAFQDISARQQAEAELRAYRETLEELVEQRTQQLALINHASQIFSSTLELDQVIQIVLSEMHRLLDIEATSYWLYVPETGELVCQQASGPGSEAVVGWRLAPNLGLTGRAVRTGQTLIIADTLTEPEHFTGVDEHTGVVLRSLLTIPLRIKGEIIGVLNLGDTQPGRFSQDDVTLIEPIAATAASAIKNAQLYNETQQQRIIAESLRQVSTIINSSLNLNTVLAGILEQLRRVVRYDGAGLFLLDGPDLLLIDGTEQVQALIGHRLPATGTNITLEPLRQNKTLVVADIQQDARWHEDWPGNESYGTKVRGWMGAPMLRDNTAIGVLTVDSFEKGAYTDKDAQILETFANQAALAIQNARQVKRTQEALHETQLLYRVSSILAKSPDVQHGIELALGYLLAAVLLDQGSITLLEPDQQTGVLRVLIQNGRPYPIRQQVQIASQGYQQILATNQPLAIYDALNSPILIDSIELVEAYNIKSILLVPLQVRGKVIGFLKADATQEHRQFTPDEIGLAQSVADQIATALDNASLLEKEQRQRQMAESLRQVAVVLNSSLNPDEVITKILQELRKVIRYDSAGLFLVDGHDLVLTGGAHLDKKHIGYRIPIDSQVRAAGVCRSKKPMITPDVREDPYWEPEPTSGLILSWMAAPLVTGDKAIGVVTLDSFELDTYADQDVEVLQTFTNQAAIAIQNAKLFEQAQQQRHMVETALATLQATQNQLVVQEKMASLGMLTAGIAHEIKNPLNFVTSFAQLSIELAQELDSILAKVTLSPAMRAEISEILGHLQANAQNINDEGHRANSIIQSMLLHSRGGSSGQRQLTDINLLLQDAVNLAFHSLRAKNMDFDVAIQTEYDPTLEPLEVASQNLGRVFVNLINNAYYATREKWAKIGHPFEASIVVSTKNLDEEIMVSVWDNGIGITPAEKDKLFTPFFTTKPTGQGTGLGLSISYDIIVQEHQGTIFVQSQPGEYSEFVIHLPKKLKDSGI